MDITHIQNEVGRLWSPTNDCWRFFCRVQALYFGLTHMTHLLDIVECEDYSEGARLINEHPEVKHWRVVNEPEHGDAVYMDMLGVDFHIGVWVQGNGFKGILHSTKANGVVYSTVDDLKAASIEIVRYLRYDNPHLHEHPVYKN